MVYCYNTSGDLVDMDSKDICAKHIKNEIFDKYEIKVNRFTRLYNPYDKKFELESVNIGKGANMYRFIKCSKSCFDDYLIFLKTGNKEYLRLAERNI
jgi:hypothetical protein